MPQGNALVGIADRAGYPVLTVPAGYGVRDSSTGGDPIGVVLIGAPNAEQELLNDAYAFEQATKIRDAGPPYMTGPAQFGPVTGAPSMTNQSMWRCIEGSAFYHPYACNAGEVGTPSAAGPTGTAVDGDVGGTVPATLSLTLGAPASFGAVHAGRGEGLHRVDHRQRHQHRGRCGAERERPGSSDQWRVLAAVAAAGRASARRPGRRRCPTTPVTIGFKQHIDAHRRRCARGRTRRR